MKKIVLIFMLVVASVEAMAQRNVKGSVMSEQQTPVEFANVVISDGNGIYVNGVITDAQGTFAVSVDDSLDLASCTIRVSCVGYQSMEMTLSGTESVDVVLPFSSEELSEVTVVGRTSPYVMNGSTLVCNIENSALKNAGNAMDVMKQLPLVNVKGSDVSVFGKGNAVIYINNREVHNVSELQQLSSAQIKKVEVITMPGAKYSASTDAVIKVVTKRPDDGFSGVLMARGQKREKWSEMLLGNFSYASNGLTLFADYSLQDLRMLQQQTMSETIGSLQSLVVSDNTLKLKRTSHDISLGAEYQLSENSMFGARYNRTFLSSGRYDVLGDIRAYEGSLQMTDYDQESVYKPEGNNNSINAFYSGKLAGWNLDVNCDYIFGDNKTAASYDNAEAISGMSDVVNSVSSNDYRLGAAKVELSRTFGKSQYSFGVDYAHTKNSSSYENDNEELQSSLENTSTLNKQDMFALFFNYGCTLWQFNIRAGLRYEYVSQEYFMNDVRNADQCRNYSNLFPSLSISRPFADGKLRTSLSYRRSVSRPTYYQLRGDIQYNSPYSYEAGNPLLRNTFTDDISGSLSYSDFTLMASFRSYSDKIIFTVEQFRDEPVTMSGFENVDGFKTASLSVLWNKTLFKRWTPRLQLGYEQQFLTLDNSEGRTTYDRPHFYAGLYSVLDLPKEFTFVVSARYSTAHSSGVTVDRSCGFVDVTLQKALFKNSLVVTLGAENIFHTYKDKWTMDYKGVTASKSADNDSCFVYLSLTYQFRRLKGYSGRGTRNSEAGRLNML